MARNEQLIRQHKILQLLEAFRFGRTLEEIRDDLVDQLGLSSLHVRSVRRDLEALQAAGLDVAAQDSQRGKVWKLGPRAKSAYKIPVSATELIALSLSRDLLYPLAGTPFWQGIESFWSRLREELPGPVWDHYQKYRQALFVRGMPAKSYEAKHGILSTIHRSIAEHRVLEIEYQAPGKDAATRRVEPLAVVFYQASLYILCLAHNTQGGIEERIRHLKLDRFTKATALDLWFKFPEDFKPEEHLVQSLGIFSGGKARDFKVKLSAIAARWVEEDPWRADQQIAKQPDGSVILTVKAAHELEVIPRVLAFGAEASLISPASARRSMGQLIRKMLSLYNDEDEADSE